MKSKLLILAVALLPLLYTGCSEKKTVNNVTVEGSTNTNAQSPNGANTDSHDDNSVEGEAPAAEPEV